MDGRDKNAPWVAERPAAPSRHFETLALPVALRKKMGVIVMQVFAQEKLLPTMPAREMLKLSRKLAATGKASLDLWFSGYRDV